MRLTFAPTGDDKTYKPVTSSYQRASKDGNVDIISLFLGGHYSLAYEGTLTNTQAGNYTGETIQVLDSNLELAVTNNGAAIAENIATFNAYGYLYPGTKIKGHLKIDETTHVDTPVPIYENIYKLRDPITNDELFFTLTRDNNNAVFKVTQIREGGTKVLHTEALAVGVDEIHFEFWYLVNGRSKLYSFSNFGISGHTKTRLWIGDVTAVLGEVEISARIRNGEAISKKFVSDYLIFKYFRTNLRYDNDPTKEYNGQVKVYDDKLLVPETSWQRVRSRDHKFVGNRVIENGMIRIIIKTSTPVIEIWGWDDVTTSTWIKTHDILTDSDAGVSSTKVQSFSIEHMTKEQIKFLVSFGTTSFIITMTRGNPYINVVNKFDKIFRVRSAKTRFAIDVPTGSSPTEEYALVNTWLGGSPVERAQSSELINVANEQGFTRSGFEESGFVMTSASVNDNYGCYYDEVANDVVGWTAFMKAPDSILVEDETGTLKYTHTHFTKGNIYAIGVLVGTPSVLTGGIPDHLVVGTQDTYVKYRANEGPFAFKTTQTVKKKQL